MSSPRVIKRYANRKLYDTAESRYIKLDEIAAMIKAGEDIQIIDNKTKADLTAVTMAQILVEEEKQQRRTGGLNSLRSLIQQSGALISRVGEPVGQMRATVEESVTRLIKSGEERAALTRESVQGWLETNTAALEELQQRIDDRARQAVAGLDPFSGARRQLDEIIERIERIEAHLGLANVPAEEEVEDSGEA